MFTKLPAFAQSRIPRTVHCATCGSEEIRAVCHHCGALLCAGHVNTREEVTYPVLLFFRRLRERFIYREEIPEFHQLRIPSRPQRGTYFDPGTLLYVGLWDDLYFLWEQFRYELDSAAARFRLFWLGNPIRQRDNNDNTAHCGNCLHYARSFYPLIRAGFWITLVSLGWAALLLVANLGTGRQALPYDQAILGLVLGGLVMLLGSLFNLLLYVPEQQRAVPESILMECAPASLTVVERVHGQITLDAHGKYQSSLSSANTPLINGEILATYLLDERSYADRTLFREKARFLGVYRFPHHIRFGFLVLNGVWWRLYHTPHAEQRYGVWSPTATPTNFELLVPPKQPRIASMLDLAQGAATFPTQRSFRYESTHLAGRTLELPCQMIVSFARDLQMQAVDIEIEIVEPSGGNLDGACIHSLEILVPRALGIVAGVDPIGAIDLAYTGSDAQIRWKNLSFDTNTRPGRCTKNIVIQFRSDVKVFQASGLHGTIELHYPGLSIRKATLKSVMNTGRPYQPRIDDHAVLLFDAFGNRRDVDAPAFETHVKASFQLDLRGLRVERIHRPKTQPIEREGVCPNNERVASIIDQLNREKFYIKRVTENPPPTSKEDAHQTQHFWGIHGRAYEGVYPVDFHIVLTGKEAYNGGTGSRIQAEIHVEAAVTKDEMGKKADAVAQRLQELIRDALA